MRRLASRFLHTAEADQFCNPMSVVASSPITSLLWQCTKCVGLGVRTCAPTLGPNAVPRSLVGALGLELLEVRRLGS